MNRPNKFALAATTLGTFYLLSPAAPVAAQTQSPAVSAATRLDYEFFKVRIQPIFLKRRSADYSRCYACHEQSRHPAPWGPLYRNSSKGSGLRLEKLEPGKTDWTEEQSRKNFQMASQLVVPGNVALSVLLIRPLAPEKGGDAIRLHSGGRQFPSMDDPDWQILSQWVNGATMSAPVLFPTTPASNKNMGPNAR